MNRIIGCILLIIGTSIGGGLLALPIATAAGGFWYSSLLLIAAWIGMMLGAFLILEVSLWLPEDTNLVSMAKHTLGRPGEIICWMSYLMLLYCLLCAYIAGGTDLFGTLLHALHISAPGWLDSILFTVIFATIVWQGIRFVDKANRGLMSIKVVAYFLLIFMIAPVIKIDQLATGKAIYLLNAVMVVITSFGYAIIVPSLRTYLKSNAKKLRLAILVGSLIPLLCYIAWDYVVQGTIPKQIIINIAQHGNVISNLTRELSAYSNSHTIATIAHVFTSVCILTSFLGVSLSLSDFLTDGLKFKKCGTQKCLVYLATFLPPLSIIIFYPYAFIAGLKYAGAFCVIVLMLLPAAMAWSGRYIKNLSGPAHYQMWGGKPVLVLILASSAALILFALLHG